MNTTPSYPMQPQTEDSIDLRKWIGKLFANWYWFVFSVMVFVGAAYMYTRYQEPTSKVKATLMIKEDDKGVASIETLFSQYYSGGFGRYMDNEIQILKSRSLAKRALNEVNFEVSYVAVGRWSERQLYRNTPFRVITANGISNIRDIPIYIDVLTDSTFQIRIYDKYNINKIHHFQEAFIHDNFSFILSYNPNYNIERLPDFMRTGEYYFKVNDLDVLASYYAEELQAEFVDQNSTLIELSLTGFSARKGVDYLNTLIDEYIKMGLEEKNQTAKNTVEFIDTQLAGIEDSLRTAEATLSSFRQQKNVVDLGTEGQSILDRLETRKSEKALIDLRIKRLENLIRSFNESQNLTELISTPFLDISDPAFTAIITSLRDLDERKRELARVFAEESQSIETINIEISLKVESLKEILNDILQAEIDLQSDVHRRINNVNREMSQLPETQRQLITMESDVTITNELYTFLTQKRFEAAIAEASNVPDQKIVDEARTDTATQVAPKANINYAIGALLGLLLPFIIIVLRDFMNNKIREKEDVEKVTDVPIIGSVGHNRRDEFVPAVKHARSSIAESFRSIRTDLQFLLYKENKKVVMVTSTMATEGKSFVSMNLAGIFSVTGKKTVVVGLDLRLPVIHKYMTDVDNSIGVSTHIIGKSKLDEIIFTSEYENLFYIPAGPAAPNPAELLQTPEFEEFINELKSRFDIIILDTPPVALVTDASLIARHTDANLYIVRQNHTNKIALSFIEQFAGKEHVKNLHIVINDVVVPKYYGYKYGYGYGYGYGKGYGSGYYVEE